MNHAGKTTLFLDWPFRQCRLRRIRRTRAERVLIVHTTLAPPVPHRRGFFLLRGEWFWRETYAFPPMKNTNQTIRPTPARRRRFKIKPTFRQSGTMHQSNPPQRPYAANDLLVLCYYPGMQPDQSTAA